MENKQMPKDCTLAQYREEYASAGLYAQLERWIKVSYAAFVWGVVLGLFLNPLEIPVCAVLLAVSKVGIGKKRIQACALVMAIVGAVMFTLMMISGLLWLVCGVAVLGVFKKIDAEYNELMAIMNA